MGAPNLGLTDGAVRAAAPSPCRSPAPVSAGTIRRRGNAWQVQVSMGRRPDGRRLRRSVTVYSLESARSLLGQLSGRSEGSEVTAPATRRWPLEPLLAASGCATVSAIEARTGLPRGIGRRWVTHGLTDDAADRVAVALGRHPAEVWPDWA